MNFTRGDTFGFYFERRDAEGKLITTKAEKAFFTVKTDYFTKDIQIQKKLDNGITFDTTTSKYHVTIDSSDTKNMPYGKYVFDIKIINNNNVNTIKKGTINLDYGVTFEYE